ncbi:MAG: hypothetical protein QOJ99_1893 [Bryobacterales bacterium]|nr:hypothetical protein [Bryobacterales bacterium]
MTRSAISVALTVFAIAPALAVTVQPRGEFLDRTRDLQHAIDQCPRNGSVVFAPGTYQVSTLQLKPGCTYRGESGKSILRLTAKNRFIFDLSERSDIRIEGLVFDANRLGGALLAALNAPVRNIHVENCTFRNVVSASVYPANIAVFSSWAIIDSAFLNNSFVNVAGGITVSTVQNLTISGNTFTDVTQSDAIFIAPNAVPFRSGEHIIISNNSGTGLAKMGIEIFLPHPPNGSQMIAPVVENNTFSTFTATNNEGMGLSITHGDGALVRNNKIDNTNGTRQENGIGIEVIVRNAQVTKNTITKGFGFGMALQGTSGNTLSFNNITGMWKDGIVFSCDNGRNRCDSSGSRLESNVIDNARLYGIRVDNNWANTAIVSNTINRAGGYWPDDATLTFTGIKMCPAKQPVTVRSNIITQTSKTPPHGFVFRGIELNPEIPGATVADNVIRSLSPVPLGEGLSGQPGAGWILDRNQFVNLVKGK